MQTNEFYCTFDNVNVEILNVETFKPAADIFTDNKIDEHIVIMSKYNNHQGYKEHNISISKQRYTTCTLEEAIDKIKEHEAYMNSEQDESY